MHLRELIAMPELQLELHYAPEGALDGVAQSTFLTDLLDPSRYLSGGELVLSGLVWRRTPEDSDAFVRALVGAGVVGLIAGEAHFGHVPGDVVEACRRHSLLLVSAPVQIAFGDITERVLGATDLRRHERVASSLGRRRILLTEVAEGRPIAEVVDRVSLDLGVVCRVLSASGEQIAPGPAPLGDDDLDRIARVFLTAARLPAVVVGAERPTYSVFSVGPGFGARLTSWIVVVEGNWSQWPPHVTESVIELATIVTLERARREEGRRTVRTIHDDAVALVAAGAARQPETAVRLRQCGVDPDMPLAVAVAGFAETEWREEERAILADAATHVGASVVAPAPDGYTVAILPAIELDYAERLRRALVRLTPALSRNPLSVGISEASTLAALSGMWEEARHAQLLAQRRSEVVSVVTGGEVTSHVLLLATVPDDVREMFAARVVGPVIAYDARQGTQLVETLEAFLRCSGSWSRTASELNLHLNTVRYRIAKVEELIDRDLSELEHRVDVFLALRSRHASAL